MRDKSLPTQQELHRLFRYDADTGRLFNRFTRNSNAVIGKQVGSDSGRGYLRTQVDGSPFMVHRIVWKMVTGSDPEDMIDHINGNTSDNRFENLRVVDNSTNQLNQHTEPRSNSGIRGVRWRDKSQSWECKFRRRYIGNFKSLLDAVACRLRAERMA